jgi:hypothetical protein
MIKETLTLFLAHQQQTLENDESNVHQNESTAQSPYEQLSEIMLRTDEERELHAAQIIQVDQWIH